ASDRLAGGFAWTHDARGSDGTWEDAMKLQTPVYLLAIGMAPASFAHHGFAPHFDSARSVTIEGTVIEFEERNPHSYLHLAVIDDAGRPQEWVCESHGVTMLQRNGVTPDLLRPGVKL